MGQNVVVSPGVTLGRNVKVQNNVSIYSGTVVEDDVFLGPSCVLTNVSNPRSQIARQNLYEPTRLKREAPPLERTRRSCAARPSAATASLQPAPS